MPKKELFLAALVSLVLLSSTPALATMPASGNYKLKDFGFGGGGTAKSDAAGGHYSLDALVNELSNKSAASGLYKILSGFNNAITANVPPAPTITNPSSYYNKLHLTVNNGSNPTDTDFALAISTDDFVADTRYVQADHTLGASPVWQTYTEWSGASGFDLVGLVPATTYYVKASAMQGFFTQSPWGPKANTATVTPSLTFTLETTSQPTPPFSINIGSLVAATVVTSTDKAIATVSTNANNGATVYLYGANAGLVSTIANYTISSGTTDLAGALEGYGARSYSLAQTSGGPMEALSPYNGADSNVGVINSSEQVIFDSSGAPVSAGVGQFELKAKAKNTTPAATDYADTLTVVAAASF